MQLVSYLIYNSLWKLVRLIPERTAYALFQFMAKLAYQRNGSRVQRLRKNYEAVLGLNNSSQLEDIVRQGLSSAMRYWCDTFRISDWSRERIFATVKTHNEEFLLDPVQKKRGLIVALPHAGNWDHAGAYFCARGVKVNTVAEHLKPERLFRKFLAHRQAMGIHVLDLNAGVSEQLVELLQHGELVALVADRDLSRSGIDVNFFGKTARMPAGPAMLAYRTGADLITAFVAYSDEGIEIFFTAPVNVNRQAEMKQEVSRVTQVLATRFESDIKNNLSSWHMQQRVFIDEGFVQRG